MRGCMGYYTYGAEIKKAHPLNDFSAQGVEGYITLARMV